jgi:hypothetical protein
MYRCPGPTVRAEQWKQLQSSREATIGRLSLYLSEEACVAGVPTEVGGLDPYADELGKAFVSLVRHEMTGHKDSVESLRSMRAIATLFSEILHLIATADLPSEVVAIEDAPFHYTGSRERLSLDGLKQFNADASELAAIDPQGSNTLELAKLLGDAFPKAWAEYRTAAQKDDTDATLHHAAILGDIYSEMVDVLQYMQLRDEQEFTEFRIPELRALLNTTSD